MKKIYIGEKFGRLTVLKIIKGGRTRVNCICECGNLKTVDRCHLVSGATKSCGCLQKERASQSKLKHGGKGKALYNRWKNMRQRCNNPKNPAYKNYGGRSIKVHESWNDYSVFEKWALKNGYKENLQIDRIDNNGNYCPDNCRFVTSCTNNSNRRITVKVEGMTLREISKKHKIKYSTVRSRYYQSLKKGFTPDLKMLITSQS